MRLLIVAFEVVGMTNCLRKCASSSCCRELRFLRCEPTDNWRAENLAERTMGLQKRGSALGRVDGSRRRCTRWPQLNARTCKRINDQIFAHLHLFSDYHLALHRYSLQYLPRLGRVFIIMDWDYEVRGIVSRVSLDYFLQNILPPLPKGLDIDEVMNTLKRSGVTNKSRRPFAKNGRWTGFAAKYPSDDSERTKEQAFRGFPGVVDAICKAATRRMSGVDPLNKFVQKINDEPYIVEEPMPDDTLPDACIVPRGGSGHDAVTWDSVSAVGWYKQGDEKHVVSYILASSAGMENEHRLNHRF